MGDYFPSANSSRVKYFVISKMQKIYHLTLKERATLNTSDRRDWCYKFSSRDDFSREEWKEKREKLFSQFFHFSSLFFRPQGVN